MIKLIKELIDKDSCFYVSVSMGIDSVAAYLYLRNKSYNVIPIHINHRLRPQNDLMEQKYSELCDFNNDKPLVFYGSNLKTEADCRDFRLSVFNDLGLMSSSKNAKAKIITAHHLNDWVESYILNCLRGKPENNVLSLFSEFDNFKIIHPFLLTKKIDFRQWLIRNNYFKFVVEDETNSFSKGSRRNWIRNFLVPEMKNQKLSLEKYAKRTISKLTSELDLIKI